jgi:cytochrome c
MEEYKIKSEELSSGTKRTNETTSPLVNTSQDYSRTENKSNRVNRITDRVNSQDPDPKNRVIPI